MTKKTAMIAATETRRALELDVLASMLPADRRDRLAEILTDDDVETLKHLAREGMGENSLRALASDLGYLEAWSVLATGGPLPWPAPEPLALKFLAHHLWDPAQREIDATHGMPAEIMQALIDQGLLRTTNPHAPNTVKRRLASWSTLHRWKGISGPFSAPTLRTALKLAVRAIGRPRRRKSRRAVTRDILDALIGTCRSDRLADTRDRALLLIAFGSGGRRRSEIARLRLDQLSEETTVASDPGDPQSPPLPCMGIALGRTKTRQADEDTKVYLVGPPVEALNDWLERSDIKKGPIFRADRSLGRYPGLCAYPAIHQSDRQAPLSSRWSRSDGLQRPWTALRLSDRGGSKRGAPCRRHAAITASLPAAGGELL